MPSTEVLKRLAAYGIEVKAAASAVDEDAADRALTGKPQAGARAPTGPARPTAPRPTAARPATRQNAARGRPTRSSLQGERAPGAGGGVRRVVIDSQASRRQAARAAVPAVPAARPAARRGRGGRRRRGTYQEPAPAGRLDAQGRRHPDQLRLDGQGRRRVPGRQRPGHHQEAHAAGGDGHAHPDARPTTPSRCWRTSSTRRSRSSTPPTRSTPSPSSRTPTRTSCCAPPVVTIMGHVDHGKTSLLDAIRTTEVAAGEAGGITQHIGAYQVHHGDRPITFLDTPGHEAFTAMRARGGQAGDIAVIVVAADDGVKPQTREAVDHAKAAEVPMLVAVNKIDKEGAQPDRVRTEMTQLGLQPEEWGGDTMFVDVSAKAQTNLDDLLESILLLAEVEELKANPDIEASGVVIESKLDPGRGAVVTVLVQRGTLKVGDAVVAGAHWGRVRAMSDFLGTAPEGGRADPSRSRCSASTPCPRRASTCARSRTTAARAQLAGERATRLKTEALARRSGKKVSLETIFDQARAGGVQELNLVLKADVSGSLEAVRGRDRQAAPGRGRGRHHLERRRRHHGVRRQPRGGLRRGGARLQRAARSATPASWPTARAWRSAPTRSSTARSTSCATPCRACSPPRRSRRPSASPRCARCSAPRGSGNIAGSYVTEGKITRGAKARLVRDGTIVYERRDRLAAPLQRRRARGRDRLRVRHRAARLPGHQGRRPDRGLRDAGRSSGRSC